MQREFEPTLFFGLIFIRKKEEKKFESTDHHITTTIIGRKTTNKHEFECKKENEKEKTKHKIGQKAKYDGIVCGHFFIVVDGEVTEFIRFLLFHFLSYFRFEIPAK